MYEEICKVSFKLATEDLKGYYVAGSGNNANIKEYGFSESVVALFTDKRSFRVIGSNDKPYLLKVAGGTIEENIGV